MDMLTRTQREAVEEFFARNVDENLEQCHNHVEEKVLPQLVASDVAECAEIKPNVFQGAFSYTCLITLGAKPTTIVQFREKEQDLAPIHRANRVHAPSAPEVQYRGTFRSLHVYTSQFMQGEPCIYKLIEADMDASTEPRFNQTVQDLARFLTGDARPSEESMVNAAVSRIEQKLESHKFKNRKLRRQILRCVEATLMEPSVYDLLPHVFSHQDIHPHNFLVDTENGKITAVLDWDAAKDDVVGRNFHFADNFLGVMTPGGWYSNKDQALEDIFYGAAIHQLQTQGFENVTQAQLAAQKTIGAIEYHLFKSTKIDERTERYLDWYSSPTV